MTEEKDNTNRILMLGQEINENIRLGGDGFIFCCGKTGSGKSRFFMLNFVYTWYNEILKREIPEYAITGDVADYMASVDEAEKYDCLVCDEASDQFSTDNKSDPATKALYHMYQQTREAGLLHILVMPSFFDLLPAIRDSDLIKFLVYTHTRTPNICKDCGKKHIYKKCDNCGSTNYKSGFTHYKVYDQKALDVIREKARSLKTKRFEVAARGVHPLIDSTTIPFNKNSNLLEAYNKIKNAKMTASKSKANTLVKNIKKKEAGDYRCKECASLNIQINRKGEIFCKRCGHMSYKKIKGTGGNTQD